MANLKLRLTGPVGPLTHWQHQLLGADRADRTDRADRADMIDRADMADRADWADTADRADRADKADRADMPTIADIDGKYEIMTHWPTTTLTTRRCYRI